MEDHPKVADRHNLLIRGFGVEVRPINVERDDTADSNHRRRDGARDGHEKEQEQANRGTGSQQRVDRVWHDKTGLNLRGKKWVRIRGKDW